MNAIYSCMTCRKLWLVDFANASLKAGVVHCKNIWAIYFKPYFGHLTCMCFQKDASYLNQISGSVVKKLLHYLGSSYRNPIATSIWLHFWHFYHNYALLASSCRIKETIYHHAAISLLKGDTNTKGEASQLYTLGSLP